MRIFFLLALAALALLLALPAFGGDFAKGQEAYNSADYDTAIAEWQTLAQSGDVEAQFGMASLYSNGFGVPLDDAEALKWYSLAADQGHAEAMCKIAIMHANGWGVPQSDAEAFKWYGLAAEGGDVMAQVNIARMLSDGYWEVQDKAQAYKWLSIASEMGEISAHGKRDELAAKMSAEEISEGILGADVWMERYRIQLAHK
jgi:TPR repeat protein